MARKLTEREQLAADIAAQRAELARWLKSDRLEPIPRTLAGLPVFARFAPIPDGTRWPLPARRTPRPTPDHTAAQPIAQPEPATQAADTLPPPFNLE